MAKFYVIATPIGNLEDITFRAVRILKEVDLILCEDTRVTKKLLSAYAISTPTASYNAKSTIAKKDFIFNELEAGKSIALVSDAGTPGISDPGMLIVSQVRERFGDDVEIIPIPGSSALIAALSASGLPASEFVFLGFLPHKKGRETLFKEISQSARTTVFYESPHRFKKTLESLKNHLDESRQIVVGRELTKVFEEIKSGTAGQIREYFSHHDDKVRGEFVVIVSGK